MFCSKNKFRCKIVVHFPSYSIFIFKVYNHFPIHENYHMDNWIQNFVLFIFQGLFLDIEKKIRFFSLTSTPRIRIQTACRNFFLTVYFLIYLTMIVSSGELYRIKGTLFCVKLLHFLTVSVF